MKRKQNKAIIYFAICGLLTVYCTLQTTNCYSQGIAINTIGAGPDNSAMLDITATDKGMLIPRMTDAQRQLLKDPAQGLMIYNITTNEINFWNGTGWYRIPDNNVSATSGGGTVTPIGIAINIAGNGPDQSAMLDVSSTDKGMLIPRTTPGAVTPVPGLIIYNTATDKINYYNGASWQSCCAEFIDNNKGTGATAGGVSISVIGGSSDASAILDVASPDKGLLIPRMTPLQRDAIPTPAQGLIIYNNTDNRIESWSGSAWYESVYYPPSAPTAGNNGPVCEGSSLSLTATTISGATYSWTGPLGFTSSSQNPTVSSSATTGMAGTYNVTVTVGGCTSSVGSTSVTINTVPTITTTAISSITQTTASSGGNVTTDGGSAITARGVCWNTSTNPTTANSHTTDGSGTGSFISSITGLSSGITYHVRAYATNTCGTAYGSEVDFTTTASFSCGSTLTITHTVGAVAPETKTVNYGTVLTNLSGASKCWITRNLGASQQATSATDNTEASAGWYWQFSLTQGYQYTTSRTPSTTWISSIGVTGDWIAANDPCTLLLGTGWRIPTYTEWLNADANGPWASYNQTYSSVLKLHAAGQLDRYTGVLGYRGSDGEYWSSTQHATMTNAGWFLIFGVSSSSTQYYNKANGVSVRCIKD